MGQRPIQFGVEAQIVNIVGAGNVTVLGTLAALPAGARSTGRLRLRFTNAGANLTLGDGTLANALVILGQRSGGAAAAVPEMLGFAGIALGGAFPQIPMLNSGGATPRDFSMLIDLADGYENIGLAAYANNQAIAGGSTFQMLASWVLGGGDQPAGT